MMNSSTPEACLTFRTVFVTKDGYQHVAAQFYPSHSKNLNLLLHLVGALIQMWGVVQLLLINNLQMVVYAYMALVALSCPLAIGVTHSVCFWMLMAVPTNSVVPANVDPIVGCVVAFFCAILMPLGHRLSDEPPFMKHYLRERPYLLFYHTIWQLPLLMDAYSPLSTVKHAFKEKK